MSISFVDIDASRQEMPKNRFGGLMVFQFVVK